jgi:hypothetical protein
MEDAGVSTLHIASAGFIVGRSLPGTVSMLVSVFPDKARSFEYRPPVRSPHDAACQRRQSGSCPLTYRRVSAFACSLTSLVCKD